MVFHVGCDDYDNPLYLTNAAWNEEGIAHKKKHFLSYSNFITIQVYLQKQNVILESVFTTNISTKIIVKNGPKMLKIDLRAV